MNFDHIILEKEQKDLFIRIVETMKNIPRENRGAMIEANAGGETYLIMPTEKPGQADIEGFARGDLDIIAETGLMRAEMTKSGGKRFNLRPQAYLYYEWLMKQQGKPVERIQQNIFRYFEFEDFRKQYGSTYRKIKEAEELLLSADKEEQFTTIGHLCREAVQDFADELYRQVFKEEFDEPIERTNNRIEKIISEKCESKKVRKFLRTLFDYWKAVGGLIQKQEHRGQKENEQLTAEDARRVVFQTANVMYELHRTFTK